MDLYNYNISRPTPPPGTETGEQRSVNSFEIVAGESRACATLYRFPVAARNHDFAIRDGGGGERRLETGEHTVADQS